MKKIILVLTILLWGQTILSEWIKYDAPQQIKTFFFEYEDSIYAAGDYGHVFHWNGISWETIETPDFETVFQIHKTSDDILLITADDVILLQDGESEWQTFSMDSDRYGSCIAGHTRDALYASAEAHVYQYENGLWNPILETADMSDHDYFGRLIMTREGDLFVSGFNMEAVWFPSPGYYFYFRLPSATYKFVDDVLVPFAGVTSGDGHYAAGRSNQDLYFTDRSKYSLGQTNSVTHFNGCFFTEFSELDESYEFAQMALSNGLFLFNSDKLVYWDSTVPLLFPDLPNDDNFRYTMTGISETDFWFSGMHSLYRWSGPLPSAPAETGAYINMTDTLLVPGDEFRLELVVGNSIDEPIKGNVYLVMMIFGVPGLWFWPEWSQTPENSLSLPVDLAGKSMKSLDTLEFQWPDIEADFDGLFHSILLKENGEISYLKTVGFSARNP